MSNPPSARLPVVFLVCCAICFALAGCQVFKRSNTWEKVTKVRGTRDLDPDASEKYASRLHDVLKADAVEHKVVTYQYRYTTRLREEAVSTRTAVLYKDKATPGSPWWLMDDQLEKPVWLPNAQVERQVEFYLHQPAQVVAQSDFGGGDAGKSVITDAPLSRPMMQETRIATAKAPAFKHQKPERVANEWDVPTESTTSVAATEERKPTWFKRAVALFRLPHHTDEATTPTAEVSELDRAFRSWHGTDYNPSSAKDRRKMEHLKQVLLRESKPVRTATS
jgi:hypothetical protein